MTGWAIAINADPPDGTGDPAYAAQVWRNASSALMGWGGGDAFDGRQGVRPTGGTAALVVELAGSDITVNEHASIVTPSWSTVTGSYQCALTESESHTLAPADGASARTDIVVGRVYDDDEDSSGLREYRSEYITGTPGPGAPAPALPQGAVLLATISVPSSGSGSPSLNVNGPFTAAAGGILPVRSTAASQADWPANPYPGQHVFSIPDGLHFWNGSAWQAAGAPTIQVFTSNGTWVKPTGVKAVRVRVQAGGGAGGGSASTAAGQASLGGGGGAGEFREGIFAAGALAATVAVSVGTGGTGVSAATGGGGGASGFGSHITASGGSGGPTLAPGTGTGLAAGGGGGSGGSGGAFSVPGGAGGTAYRVGGLLADIGYGGSSFMSGAARGPSSSGNLAGVNASIYGGGGSGAISVGAVGSNNAGGNGSGGIVIVESFF